MKIIITGASGYVGRNLSKKFQEQGYEVVPLPLRGNGWMLADDAVAVIHLAGIEKDTGNADIDEYLQVNSFLTEEVYKQFLTSNIRDFIFFSSIKAAADSLEEVLTEETPEHPKTPYGKSKLRAEQLLQKHSLPPGKRLFILRPCLIHGPGDKGNMRLLYNVVARGLPYPLGAFQNKKSYISTGNLQYILISLLQNSTVKSGLYNIADDSPLSTNQLIEIISSEVYKKTRIWKIPVVLWRILLRMMRIIGLKTLSEKIYKLTDSFVVSNAKIKGALGITSLPLAAEEGFRLTLKSFKS